MQQVTIQNGSTIPFILKAGEYIKITTSSLGAGTVAVPGESIADTLVASTEYAYGKFSAQREVIVLLTAGSADVEIDSGAPPLAQSRQSSGSGVDSASSVALARSGFGGTPDQKAFRNFKSSNTSTLRRIVADARAGYARSRLGVFGMSTEAGAGSLSGTLYGTNNRSKSWPMLLASILNAGRAAADLFPPPTM